MIATDYFEGVILNTLRGVGATAPTTVYAALFLSNPTDSGTAGNEIIYNGYTRQAVEFGIPGPLGGSIGVQNINQVIFPESPSDSGLVTYAAIYDALTGGNMLCYGQLTTPLQVRAGNQPSFGVSQLQFFLIGSFTNYFKTATLSLLRGQSVSGFDSYLSLWNGDPEVGGAELQGDTYSRPYISFTAPVHLTTGQSQISNDSVVQFSPPSSNWGNWLYTVVFDASSNGNPIIKSQRNIGEDLLVGYTPSAKIGDIKIAVN
jgi:hypothetical protein